MGIVTGVEERREFYIRESTSRFAPTHPNEWRLISLTVVWMAAHGRIRDEAKACLQVDMVGK